MYDDEIIIITAQQNTPYSIYISRAHQQTCSRGELKINIHTALAILQLSRSRSLERCKMQSGPVVVVFDCAPLSLFIAPAALF
jgi:hypothetical protein